MSGWWVQQVMETQGFVGLFSRVFWVIGSIVLHELAHGWAALWQGDDTPRRLDRMTLNPLVHMGPMSLLVFAIAGIAWGLMPTDPSRYRSRRWGRILVAAAGPAMNIVLAFICLTALGAVLAYGDFSKPATENLRLFLSIGGIFNVILAVLNLLPVPPLDGSAILAGLSRPYARLLDHPNAMMVGFGLLIILLVSGLFGVLWTPLVHVGIAWANLVATLLGAPV
ncbi:MAG TPA: site-2 protease family protein [Phycisphaerales bacterium]|nr:site-2 protease family protein [Phycisphaerales bacterium]HMP38664.1 site-2 protease family protein [Phycisphaerales bacterium]